MERPFLDSLIALAVVPLEEGVDRFRYKEDLYVTRGAHKGNTKLSLVEL